MPTFRYQIARELGFFGVLRVSNPPVSFDSTESLVLYSYQPTTLPTQFSICLSCFKRPDDTKKYTKKHYRTKTFFIFFESHDAYLR